MRDSLFAKIDAVAKDASQSAVEAAFAFASCGSHEEGDADNNETDQRGPASITPLMYACDRAKPSCVKYIQHTIAKNPTCFSIWGHPLDAATADYSNTAFHYAASSGCRVAVDALCSILASITHHVHNVVDTDPLSTVLSLTNENGDTAIMMATAAGHLPFLEAIYDSTFRSKAIDLTPAFSLRNNAGQSALTLACGHGHLKIIDFLLDHQLAAPTYEIIDSCKATLSAIDQALERMSKGGTAAPKQYMERRTNVKRCLVTMQVAFARSTQKNMEELLSNEEQAEPDKKQSAPTKGKRISSKATSSRTVPPQQKQQQPQSAWGASDQQAASSSIDSLPINVPRFKTLSDGTLVSDGTTLEQHDTNEKTENQKRNHVQSNEDDGNHSSSMDDLMKARLSSNPHQVDAIMDSLCLDASMLLLTPHGMALNLSPSQLDAVQDVLSKQLDAVRQAKEIQSKLRTPLPSEGD